jgi:hypothetical protein
MVIPKPLQRRAVLWFHHYLQHPGHTRLEETMQATMYWKGMQTTIRSITRSCKTFQVNMQWKLKYGHLLPKTVITTPWRTLFANLDGPYTLRGKEGSVIDFMALTMKDPASSWFKIVELPLVRQLKTITIDNREFLASEEISDKSSDCIAPSVNKFWLSRHPRCRYLVHDNDSEIKLNFEYLCNSYGIKHKPTTIKNPQANAILECVHQVLGQMLRTDEIEVSLPSHTTMLFPM